MIDISVIIASYQVEHVAAITAQAILEQSFPQDQYEVIWVEDGSTDRTFELLEPYLRYPHFQLVRNLVNKGRNWSRNHAISRSQGRIIIFLDSDNVVNPDFVQAYYDVLSQERYVCIGNYAIRSRPYLSPFARYWNTRSPAVLVAKGKVDPRDMPPKYLGTNNSAMLKEDYLATGGIPDYISQGSDDFLAFHLSKLGLTYIFVAEASTDHQDPTFNIKSYFQKLRKQGGAYRLVADENPGFDKLARYRYLTPIDLQRDSLKEMIIKLGISAIFWVRLPLVAYILARLVEMLKLGWFPSLGYRFVLAYAWFRGYRYGA